MATNLINEESWGTSVFPQNIPSKLLFTQHMNSLDLIDVNIPFSIDENESFDQIWIYNDFVNGELLPDQWTTIESVSLKCSTEALTDILTYINGYTVEFEAVNSSTKSEFVEYEWDFGGGNKSTDENPTHIFDSPGTHHVCLKIKDENGCCGEHCVDVVIKPSCDDMNIDLSSNEDHSVDDLLQALGVSIGELCNSDDKYLILLGGNLILDSGTDPICFGNGTIIGMMPGAKITVKDNTILNLDNVHIFACDIFWDHIYIEKGSTINTSNNTLIEDGIKAIEAEIGAFVNTENTIFNNNEIGIKLIESGGGLYTFTNIKSTTFTSDENYIVTSPLIGVWPQAGIEIEGQRMVQLKTTDDAPNTFYRLENGILVNNGSVRVTNSHFENIYETGVAYPNEPENTEFMLKHSGYAIKMLNNIFMSTIKDNTFNDVGFAIGQSDGVLLARDNVIDQSGQGIVIHKLWGLNAFMNSITTKEIGVNISHCQFFNNLNKFHDNDVTTIDNYPEGKGVFINKLTTSNPFYLFDNNIRVFNNDAGIVILNSNFCTIEENDIDVYGTMAMLQTDGIYIGGHENFGIIGNYISFNIINQNNSDSDNSGINTNEAHANKFNCNVINDFHTGMQFWGVCEKSELKGNKYNRNELDLVLGKENSVGDPEGNTYIGWQGNENGNLKGYGNLWPSPNNMSKAHNSAEKFIVYKSQFYVDAISDNNSDYIPDIIEVVQGAQWFWNDSSITNYSCTEGVPESILPTICDQIINDITVLDTMSRMDNCVKLMWQYNYYKQLIELKNKGLLSAQCLAWLTGQNNNILVQIANVKNALDSIIIMQYADTTLFENLYVVTTTLDSLYDTSDEGTTEWDQELAVYEVLLGDYEILMQKEKAKDKVEADSLQNEITYIRVVDSCLQVILNTYKLHLNLILNDSLTQQEISYLQEIAGSCPSDNGYGVFNARSLMGLYENVRYPRMEECYYDGVAPRNIESINEADNKLEIYPNPATDEVNILIDIERDETGIVEVLDINNNIIQIFDTNKNQKKFDINVSNYASGVYFVKYSSIEGKHEIKKLVIAK